MEDYVEDRLSMRTNRQQMIMLLSGKEHSARDLSAALGIREKEVYDHLFHIKRSLVPQGKSLNVNPAQCLECQYIFRDRARLTTPGKCPRCRGTHIQDPKYRVV